MPGSDVSSTDPGREEPPRLFSPTAVASLLRTSSVDEIYRWGMDQLHERTAADTTAFATRREGLLVPIVSTNAERTGQEHAISLETSIPGSVLIEGEGVVIDDLTDRRSAVGSADDPTLVSPERNRSMLCVPVANKGVLVALSHDPAAFDDADLQRGEAIASLVADALENIVSTDGPRENAEVDTLEEIAQLLSHDMVNKLSVAQGRLELARGPDGLDHLDDCERALEGIESIASIAATLARTGGPIERTESVDLGHVAREVFETLQTDRASLSVVDAKTIEADHGCLVQLLENLFRNAIDHSESPVTIEVAMLENGFSVADDGPGIPANIRDSVRQSGFSTRAENTGMGLAIVERLASAHRWTMQITDSAAGGTQVEFHGVSFP